MLLLVPGWAGHRPTLNLTANVPSPPGRVVTVPARSQPCIGAMTIADEHSQIVTTWRGRKPLPERVIVEPAEALARLATIAGPGDPEDEEDGLAARLLVGEAEPVPRGGAPDPAEHAPSARASPATMSALADGWIRTASPPGPYLPIRMAAR